MIGGKILSYTIWLVLMALCILEFVYVPLLGVRPGFTEAPPFWQQPLRVILFHQIWLISPALVKSIEFILCWTFGLGFWFGFRQISDRNVLDHPERSAIHVFIRDHPGIHFREMVRDMGINRGTLSYHLAMLVQTKKILAVESGGYTRYFENSGKFSSLERKVLASLADANRSRILWMMVQSPVTQSELKDHLHLSGPSIMWHIHRMSNDQLVKKNETVRPVQYELPDEVSRFLRNRIVQTEE